MMRLLAIDGQTSAALGQYERCWQLLRQELNVEPSAETQALAEMIRTGQMNPSPAANHHPSPLSGRHSP